MQESGSTGRTGKQYAYKIAEEKATTTADLIKEARELVEETKVGRSLDPKKVEGSEESSYKVKNK